MRLKPVFFILLFSCVLLLLTSIPAFASNYGYIVIDDKDQIQKFDLSSYSIEQTITLTGMDQPTTISMSPDGSKYYVLNVNGLLKSYNVADDTVQNSLNLGNTSGYDTLIVSKNGSIIYLVHANCFYIINAINFNIIYSTQLISSGMMGYASITNDESKIYIPYYDKLFIIDTIPNPDPGAPLYSIQELALYTGNGLTSYIDNYNNKLYICVNNGTHTLYIYDKGSYTKNGEITLDTSNMFGMMITPDNSNIGVTLYNSDKIIWVSTSTYQITSNTSLDDPCGIISDIDNTRWYITARTNDQVIIFDPSSKTTITKINTDGHAQIVTIGKIYSENADVYSPHNVRFTVTSYIRTYSNLTTLVYDDNNNYIIGGKTDNSGAIVFQMYSNKYYTINFNGSGINKTISMYPIGTAYDIFIEPWSTWTWQPGSSQISDVDSVITAYINGEANGVDGTITVYYQDNGSTTENVLVTVYQRYNESTNQLIDFYMIEGSGASSFNHQFNITDVVGKDYLVKVDAHSSKYGDIVKYQTYNFPSARYGIPGVNDDYVYMILGICIPLFIALAVSLRNVKFGPVVFCGASWAFVSLNWMTMFGLAYPLLLTVASIVSVVYLISMKEERR